MFATVFPTVFRSGVRPSSAERTIRRNPLKRAAYHDATYYMSSAERAEAYKRSVRASIYEFMVIALGGRLAASDGAVDPKELEAFKLLFPIKMADSEHLKEYLADAAKDQVEVTHYVQRLKTFFPSNQQMFRRIVHGLFRLAVADGPINLHEVQFIRKVNQAFELPESYLLQRFREVIVPGTTNPFQILGVSKFVTQEELKQAYRRAVRAYHPDKFSCLPNSRDIVTIAGARIKVINGAYHAVRKQRKFV